MTTALTAFLVLVCLLCSFCTGGAENDQSKQAAANAHALWRMEATAHIASVVVRHMYCKIDPSRPCDIPDRGKIGSLKDWASKDYGWERILSSLSMYELARHSWLSQDFERSIAAVEQAIVLKLFPYKDPASLQRWQQALISPGHLFKRPKLELADALILKANCMYELGRREHSLEYLCQALESINLSAALMHISLDLVPEVLNHLGALSEHVGLVAAEVLSQMNTSSIAAVMGSYGIACPHCLDRLELLSELVHQLALPLRFDSTATRLEVVQNSFVHHMYAKQEHESNYQFTQRFFSQILSMVHHRFLAELGVPCTRTAGHTCSSYQPAWLLSDAPSQSTEGVPAAWQHVCLPDATCAFDGASDSCSAQTADKLCPASPPATLQAALPRQPTYSTGLKVGIPQASSHISSLPAPRLQMHMWRDLDATIRSLALRDTLAELQQWMAAVPGIRGYPGGGSNLDVHDFSYFDKLQLCLSSPNVHFRHCSDILDVFDVLPTPPFPPPGPTSSRKLAPLSPLPFKPPPPVPGLGCAKYRKRMPGYELPQSSQNTACTPQLTASSDSSSQAGAGGSTPVNQPISASAHALLTSFEGLQYAPHMYGQPLDIPLLQAQLFQTPDGNRPGPMVLLMSAGFVASTILVVAVLRNSWNLARSTAAADGTSAPSRSLLRSSSQARRSVAAALRDALSGWDLAKLELVIEQAELVQLDQVLISKAKQQLGLKKKKEQQQKQQQQQAKSKPKTKDNARRASNSGKTVQPSDNAAKQASSDSEPSTSSHLASSRAPSITNMSTSGTSSSRPSSQSISSTASSAISEQPSSTSTSSSTQSWLGSLFRTVTSVGSSLSAASSPRAKHHARPTETAEASDAADQNGVPGRPLAIHCPKPESGSSAAATNKQQTNDGDCAQSPNLCSDSVASYYDDWADLQFAREESEPWQEHIPGKRKKSPAMAKATTTPAPPVTKAKPAIPAPAPAIPPPTPPPKTPTTASDLDSRAATTQSTLKLSALATAKLLLSYTSSSSKTDSKSTAVSTTAAKASQLSSPARTTRAVSMPGTSTSYSSCVAGTSDATASAASSQLLPPLPSYITPDDIAAAARASNQSEVSLRRNGIPTLPLTPPPPPAFPKPSSQAASSSEAAVAATGPSNTTVQPASPRPRPTLNVWTHFATAPTSPNTGIPLPIAASRPWEQDNLLATAASTDSLGLTGPMSAMQAVLGTSYSGMQHLQHTTGDAITAAVPSFTALSPDGAASNAFSVFASSSMWAPTAPVFSPGAQNPWSAPTSALPSFHGLPSVPWANVRPGCLDGYTGSLSADLSGGSVDDNLDGSDFAQDIIRNVVD